MKIVTLDQAVELPQSAREEVEQELKLSLRKKYENQAQSLRNLPIVFVIRSVFRAFSYFKYVVVKCKCLG